MVKVCNKYGDIKIGKQGSAVYQQNNGVSVRRIKERTHKGDGKKKNLVPNQKRAQVLFKEGIDFVKTLSKEARTTLASYVKTRNLNITWENYARRIVMSTPTATVTFSGFVLTLALYFGSAIVSIHHPAIKKVELYYGTEIVYKSPVLTNLDSSIIVANFNIKTDLGFTRIAVTTADDKVHDVYGT